MKYLYLSYSIKDDMPVYGGTGSVTISPVKSIAVGDTSNVFSFTMENHWGTHIDSSNHFFDEGMKVFEHPADFWCFRKPRVVDISLKPSEIMKSTECLELLERDADLLLFRSKWSDYRDRDLYGTENPGIGPEIGSFIRRNFPSVRAVGIDWVSVSSFRDGRQGVETHKVFLNPKGEGHPVLIIEDMDLSGDMAGLVASGYCWSTRTSP